jgi:hypothetical protein
VSSQEKRLFLMVSVYVALTAVRCLLPCGHFGGAAGDFRRRRFGQVLDLLPLADSVQQLKSICAVCGGKHGA